jgi:hypothetical protein
VASWQIQAFLALYLTPSHQYNVPSLLHWYHITSHVIFITQEASTGILADAAMSHARDLLRKWALVSCLEQNIFFKNSDLAVLWFALKNIIKCCSVVGKVPIFPLYCIPKACIQFLVMTKSFCSEN